MVRVKFNTSDNNKVIFVGLARAEESQSCVIFEMRYQGTTAHTHMSSSHCDCLF